MDGNHRQREYLEHARRTQAAQHQQARAYQQAMAERGPQQARQVNSMEARYDPTAGMASRAAAGFQQQNGSIPMGASQSGRRVHFDPSMEGTRHAVPRPVPPRIPMTDRVTGSGPLIEPLDDPLERLVGEAGPDAKGPYDTALELVLRTMQTLLLCLLTGSFFVVPEQAKVLWIFVAVQVLLAASTAYMYEVALKTPEGPPSWMRSAMDGLQISQVVACVVVVLSFAYRTYKTLWAPDAVDDEEYEEYEPRQRSSSMADRVRTATVALAPMPDGIKKSKKMNRKQKRLRSMM
jgi:hypothetical protein